MMLLAIGLLSSMNVFVKLIGPDYHPVQVTFIRNIIAALVIVPFILRGGGVSILRTRRPWGHAARVAAGTIGNICYFYAFARLPLADVMVISQAVPLFATVMAVMFLSERVGWRRWTAIAVGFVGVVLALDPTGTIGPASLVTVFATVCWASAILMLRSLGRTENPYTVTFYYMVAGTVLTGLVLPWLWVTPSWQVMVLFVGAGVLGAFGQLAMTYALKLAPASVVSPFNYSAILWGIAFDLVIWNAWPTLPTLAGAVVISFAGLYIFRREAGAAARGR